MGRWDITATKLMKQKLFTLLLAFIAAISFAGAKDIASGTFKNGGTWKISDQGELYIDAVTIPDYKLTNQESGSYIWGLDCDLDGYYYHRWHTSSAWDAYAPQIKTIRLSANVKTIGEYAFHWLTRVTKVSIEGSGVTIKHAAFSDCFRLTEFPFNAGVITSIGDAAFIHCGFFSINLEGVTFIGAQAFDECFHLWRRPQDQNTGNYSIKVVGTFPTVERMADYNQGLTRYENYKGEGDYVLTQTKTRIERGSKLIVVSDTRNSGAFSTNGVGEVVGGGDGWRLKNGVLTITSQQLSYNSASVAPWYAQKSHIGHVILKANNIPAELFRDYTALHTVELPEDVVSIGNNAFNGCTNLTKVTNLDNVKTIGDGAFASTRLNVVVLNAAQTIGANAFDNVTTMSQLILGEDLTSIGSYAFRNTLQSQAGSYWIRVSGSAPSSTASNAFDGVITKTLYVPAGVYASYNGKSPWSQFTLNTIVDFPVSGSNPTWQLTYDGTLTILSNIPNYSNESDQPWYPYKNYIRKVVFGNNVTTVGNNALSYEDEGESKVTSVEIPATVETIGENAFKNNDQIEVVEAEGVKNIGDEAFTNCSSLEKVKFGKDVQSLGNKVFNQCGLVDVMAVKAAVPPTVTAQTFQGLGIVSSNAPAKVKAKAAARRAPNATAATGQKATTLEVPDEHIAKYLAAQYWNLFSFEFIGEHGGIVRSGQYYDGVWVIYEDGTLIASSESSTGTIDGFYNQPGVKRVELMGGATELNWGGFGPADLPNLEEVVLSPALHKLGDEVFQNSTKLKSINLENVDSIGMRAFKGCTSLTSVNLPAVKYIANSAFENCTSLASAAVSGESFKMDYQVFKGCTSLKSIDLSGMSSLSTPTSAFSGCTALRHVKMDGTASAVSTSMFNGCSALTTVELGSDCRNVYATAFANTSLNRIYSASPTPATIEATAFTGLTLSDITAYVPADYVRIYKKADIWKDMTIAADSAYGEPMLPVGGMMNPSAGNCLWLLESDGTMTFSGEGGCSTTGAVKAQHHQLAIYMENIIYTDEITSIGSDITSQYSNYQYVKSVEIGADVKTIYENAMLYPHVTDVYCFAADVPALNANAFNKTALIANDATLHVVDFTGTLAKYQASSAWNWFPHIVADLPTRKPGTIKVTKVLLDSHDKTLYLNQSDLGTYTLQLNADVYPANATNQEVKWTTSDASIATVDQNGLVTIVGFDNSYLLDGVTITATAKDGSNKRDKCHISVWNANDIPEDILATGIDADRKSITIMKSEGAVVRVILTPANSNSYVDGTFVTLGDTPASINVMPMYDPESGQRTGEFSISPMDLGSFEVTFTATDYDDHGDPATYPAPSVSMTVNVVEDVFFTENTKEGVPVTYRLIKTDDKLVEVYGEEETKITVDPNTGIPTAEYIYHTAIDASTAGTITIPSTVRGYNVVGTGAYAFRNCASLERVDFCPGIQYVGDYAFTGCTSLREAHLPSSLKGLGNQSFSYLTTLKDVHLMATTAPDGMNGTDIWGSNAFGGLSEGEEGSTLHVAQGCYNVYNVSPWIEWFRTIVEDGEAVDNTIASYICDFTTAASKHSAYNDAWTYDTDWTVYGGANNNGGWTYAKMGGKSATLANANPVYVVNKYRFGRAIQGVRVTYPAGSFSKSGMSCNSWGVKVYSDLACTNLLYTVTGEAITAQGGTLTVRPEAGQVWKAGYGIQVYWDLANTSSTNGIVLVDKIEYLTDAEDSNPLWNQYTVRFLNWDGTVLQESDVREGFMPEYTGETPVRPMDTQFIYTFSEWSPAIVAATADADYTAQYSTEERFPDTTGIEDLFAEPDAPSALKVLHNGTLYILRPDGAIYTLQGARVK